MVCSKKILKYAKKISTVYLFYEIWNVCKSVWKMNQTWIFLTENLKMLQKQSVLFLYAYFFWYLTFTSTKFRKVQGNKYFRSLGMNIWIEGLQIFPKNCPNLKLSIEKPNFAYIEKCTRLYIFNNGIESF